MHEYKILSTAMLAAAVAFDEAVRDQVDQVNQAEPTNDAPPPEWGVIAAEAAAAVDREFLEGMRKSFSSVKPNVISPSGFRDKLYGLPNDPQKVIDKIADTTPPSGFESGPADHPDTLPHLFGQIERLDILRMNVSDKTLAKDWPLIAEGIEQAADAVDNLRGPMAEFVAALNAWKASRRHLDHPVPGQATDSLRLYNAAKALGVVL